MKIIPDIPKEYSKLEQVFTVVDQELSKRFSKGSPMIIDDSPLVIRSPDGNLWQINVNNSGILSATNVTGSL